MNLKTRKFIAETSADFWEWATSSDNDYIKIDIASPGQSMYNKFTEEYPDYGPYGRYKLSHNRFYRWMDSLGEYKFGEKPKIFRNAHGKMVQFVNTNNQNELNF
jgi:hypothetical protein